VVIASRLFLSGSDDAVIWGSPVTELCASERSKVPTSAHSQRNSGPGAAKQPRAAAVWRLCTTGCMGPGACLSSERSSTAAPRAGAFSSWWCVHFKVEWVGVCAHRLAWPIDRHVASTAAAACRPTSSCPPTLTHHRPSTPRALSPTPPCTRYQTSPARPGTAGRRWRRRPASPSRGPATRCPSPRRSSGPRRPRAPRPS
jgi:hypothetical protein